MDPVQGGTPNNYVYPTDPINDSDLTGNVAWKKNAKTAWNIACGNGWWALTCVPGIGWLGKGARVVKVAHTVDVAKAAKAARLAKNAAKGRAAEEQVYKQLVKQHGASNVRKQVYNMTSHGARRSDFLVNAGSRQFFVEVKSGNAVYSKLQRDKDAFLESELGIPTVLKRVP